MKILVPFADVDGSGELAPWHTVMLPMGESHSSSQEDSLYSACCPSSNSSSSEPEILILDPSRTAAITSWALKTHFTLCGAHNFLDSSLMHCSMRVTEFSRQQVEQMFK